MASSKNCSVCGQLLPVATFSPNQSQCRPCRAVRHRERCRTGVHDSSGIQLKSRRTRSGFLKQVYRNMTRRVTGITDPYGRYKGKPILARDLFLSWADADSSFCTLFDRWVASGHARTCLPSIDRIDNNGGYTIGNMRWVLLSVNLSKRENL